MSEIVEAKSRLEIETPLTESKFRDFSGIYRGVKYEIKTWPTPDRLWDSQKNSWTHYIVINIDQQVPENLREAFWITPVDSSILPGRKHYNYSEGPVASIEFHGGITFYDKVFGFEWGDRWVKLGCDYQHYWDMGREYDLRYVSYEAKKSIDSFWDEVCRCKPKARSMYDGKFYEIEG